MEDKIKQKLSSNWFKILQDMICNEIETMESVQKFRSSNWNRNKIAKTDIY